jgi:hypothetical protein
MVKKSKPLFKFTAAQTHSIAASVGFVAGGWIGVNVAIIPKAAIDGPSTLPVSQPQLEDIRHDASR